MIIAMYKVLFIAVLLCIAESGFAKKKIDLYSQAKSPIPPVEVSIDEDLKELIFDFEDEFIQIKYK